NSASPAARPLSMGAGTPREARKSAKPRGPWPPKRPKSFWDPWATPMTPIQRRRVRSPASGKMRWAGMGAPLNNICCYNYMPGDQGRSSGVGLGGLLVGAAGLGVPRFNEEAAEFGQFSARHVGELPAVEGGDGLVEFGEEGEAL